MSTDEPDIEALVARLDALNGDAFTWEIGKEWPVIRDALTAAARERDALRAFKQYVHNRLDAAGIPTHPEGPHSAAGCRIGDRLDIALTARGDALEEAARKVAHIGREVQYGIRVSTDDADAIAAAIRALKDTPSHDA